MFRKIAANLLVIAVVIGLILYLKSPESKEGNDSMKPTPALGRTVANAVHQALTDPYFVPLEKLTQFLDERPGRDRVSVDLLTKWAPDEDIPTCFVWETDGSKLQLDHPSSTEVLEKVLDRLKEGVHKPNPNQLLYLSSFRIEGERFWLGFIRVPLGSGMPVQMAGAFFSMREYIDSAVPRLLNNLADRARFPLIEFQPNERPPGRGSEEAISIRIIDNDGEVYYQRGYDFDKSKLLYAETQFFPKPIVAMQEGWDLQIFGGTGASGTEGSSSPIIKWGVIILALAIISAALWWGWK